MLKKLLIISLLWAILILVLSSIPGNSLPKTPAIPHFDKLVHTGLYFILSSFLIPVLDFAKHKFLHKTGIFIVMSIVGLYGGTIEIAQEQWFVNRSGDINDFYSDLAGGGLGILFYYSFAKRFLFKNLSRNNN